MSENLELREWIAVNVMGWEKRSTPNGAEYFVREGVDVSHEELPHYELTWNDAALVVEAMKARGFTFEMATWLAGDGHVARFCHPLKQGQHFASRSEAAGSAPLAICLAAKAAIEATQ